jgi:hypothetical protein
LHRSGGLYIAHGEENGEERGKREEGKRTSFLHGRERRGERAEEDMTTNHAVDALGGGKSGECGEGAGRWGEETRQGVTGMAGIPWKGKGVAGKEVETPARKHARAQPN